MVLVLGGDGPVNAVRGWSTAGSISTKRTQEFFVFNVEMQYVAASESANEAREAPAVMVSAAALLAGTSLFASR